MVVSIIGLARSGYAAARLALRLGYSVRVTDACAGAHMSNSAREKLEQHAEELRAAGVWVELGCHTRKSIEGADLVITSPGVPDTAGPLVWAREEGIAIISEIEFAVRHTSGRIVGITGTNGKTTTATLVGHILSHAGMPVVVAGNIGQPLSAVVETISSRHVVVLEISSFQLETAESFHPHIAVWLNFTPDHLDRYDTLQDYFDAKARIFMNMTNEDWAVVWRHDRGITADVLKACPARKVWIDEHGEWQPEAGESYGAWCRDDILRTTLNGVHTVHGNKNDLPLTGDHNVVNMLAACAVARILHVPEHVVNEALLSFQGLPHRIEFVVKRHGITFLNDSKATNVEAMIEAIKTTKPPISLIAGGYDKGGEFSTVQPFIKDKVSRVVLLGDAAAKLAREFNGLAETVRAASMAEAVAAAACDMPSGTTVLLSPGCASFDMYEDYEQRGNDFKNCARRLTVTMD
jgi:UDP-N-acetylmuramoylalanine--D-glutamate ligase